MKRAPVVSIVGKSDSGKTTLIERLIPLLTNRGYRVGTVKHHVHRGLELDKKGKDTWRHLKAGADAVLLIAPERLFLQRSATGNESPHDLEDLLGDVDIVLTEGGYRWPGIPKIEVVGQYDQISSSPPELVAVVSDRSLTTEMPTYQRDQVTELADFIEQRFLANT